MNRSIFVPASAASVLFNIHEAFASTALSVIDLTWVKAICVILWLVHLPFTFPLREADGPDTDGGGIRAYSSLPIVQTLMDIIAKKEIALHMEDNRGTCTVGSHTS